MIAIKRELANSQFSSDAEIHSVLLGENIYSEKATKFCKISTVDLTVTT